MRLILESTEKVVTLQIGGVNVPARVWQGHYAGAQIHAYITRVAVPIDAPPHVHDEFERALREVAAPRADVAAIPLRLVL